MTDPKLELVASRLKRVSKTRNGFKALCPAHDDHSPSLEIFMGDDWVQFKCWSHGCRAKDILPKIGLTWDDIALRERSQAKRADANGHVKRKPLDRRLMDLEAQSCVDALQANEKLLARLRAERGWAAKALRNLRVGTNGKDHHMITLPVYDRDKRLHDVLRYDPFIRKGRKVLAGEGRSRYPWPMPEAVQPNGHPLFIVEGEGTAISLASIGINAIGLPGSIGRPRHDPHDPGGWRGVGWHRSWAKRFAGHRRLVLCPDCDEAGRSLMYAVGYDLTKIGADTAMLDLGQQENGFDIGDLLRPARTTDVRREAKELILMAAVTARQQPTQVDSAVSMLMAWYQEKSSNGNGAHTTANR